MSFADEVDAALQGLRVVLGTGEPPAPSAPKALTDAPAWPNWTGAASRAAKNASDDLDRSRKRLHFDQVAAVALIKHAATVTTGARTRMDGVVAGWQQDKAQFAPIAETPLGQISLLHAGQKRLSEARDVIRDALTELSSTAGKLQTVSSDLIAASGDAPTKQPGDQAPKTPALPDDPKQFTLAWNALSPEQKEAVYNDNHFIGDHPGMPFEDKTLFNERHLDELTHNAQASVDGMQARYDQLARQQYMGDHSSETGNELAALGPRLQAARHSLDEFHGAQNAMKAPPGTPKRYLGYIDDKGHAAVSIGNPDTAIRNGILVPGTGDDLTNMGDNTERAWRMHQAAINADPNLRAADVSVTAWLGYDRPMSVLGQAPWPSYAEHGAGALDSYENGMRASHIGPPSIDTVVGHSYGTTLVGAAASDGHHLAANNVIAVASPGMLVDHAADLSINPGGAVYAMTDPHDPIGPANLFTQLTLGPNPAGSEFGAHDLYAGTHLGIGPEHGFPSLQAHSGYWNANTPALANLGALIAGIPAPFPAGG